MTIGELELAREYLTTASLRAGAQNDADRRGVDLGFAELVVDDGDVEAELAGVVGLGNGRS